MKIIKIFLASSDELKDDRISFGNFVRQLDDLYEKRGVRIKLVEWEDTDASYNGRRKQDEYNEEVRSSDIFLALFKTKAGCFTIEEFYVAKEEQEKKDTPVIFVFCKLLKPDEEESAELTKFKSVLLNELGHYPCNYNNEDSLQKEFVFQFLHFENRQLDELKLNDGVVYLDGLKVARLDMLPFAQGNQDYQKLSNQLNELSELIDKKRKEKKSHPEDESIDCSLQELLDSYNQKRTEFEQLQRALFDQAKRLSEIQIEHTDHKRQLAKTAFEEGNISKTNDIYDDILKEAALQFEQFKLNQGNVHQYIEAARDQVNAVLADTRLPVGQRILKVSSIYKRAEDYAKQSLYDDQRHICLLKEYLNFLMTFGMYEDAEAVGNYLIKFLSFSEQSTPRDVLNVHNRLGLTLYRLGKFDKALSLFENALTLCKKENEISTDATAAIYNNIGLIYHDLHSYTKALEYYEKALKIRQELPHPEEGTIEGRFYYDSLAANYLNMGQVLESMGDVEKGLSYMFMSAVFRTEKRHFGPDDPSTALGYETFGNYYSRKQEFQKALDNYQKALEIRERVLGPDNIKTIELYINLAQTYCLLEKTHEYEIYLQKAENTLTRLGLQNSKQYVDVLFCKAMERARQKRFQESIVLLNQSIEITEKLPGENGLETLRAALQHIMLQSKQFSNGSPITPNVNDSTSNVESVFSQALKYYQEKDYEQALELLEKAKSQATSLSYHLGLEKCLKLIAGVCIDLKDFERAYDALVNCLSYLVDRYGTDSPNLIVVLSEMGHLLIENGKNEEATDYFEGALDIQERTYGSMNQQTAVSHVNVAGAKEALFDYESAISHYEKALDYFKKNNDIEMQRIIGFRLDAISAVRWVEKNYGGKRKK